jgi:pimeloyl-ACP methyl ester carboxylesterase
MYPARLSAIRARTLPLASGLRLRLLESGNPIGEPVLLVHGWGACVFTFRYAMDALASMGRRALAFDLRGHGLSDKPASPNDYTTDALVDDVRAVLDALEIPRADILGHSLGGGVVLHFALAYPARVHRIVLAAPVGLTRIPVQRVGCFLTPSVLARFARYLPPRWLTSMLARATYGDPRRVTQEVIDEYWAPSQFPNYFRAARALLHEFSFAPLPDAELQRVTAPTLVILGGADRLIRGVEDRVGQFKNAEVITLNGAGHLGIEEYPARFNAALGEFLGRGKFL